MATKITKSDLKQMIREALREELKLHENTELTAKNELASILSDALAGSYHADTENVLVRITSAGQGVLSAIRAWASENGVRTYFISAQDTEFFRDPSRFLDKTRGAVLIFDEFNRVHPRDKIAATEILSMASAGQLFTIACVNGELPAAETKLFTYQHTV